MAKKSTETIWKVTLIALIIGLGLILFRQARPFFSGVLGALTFYILLRDIGLRLRDRFKNPVISASIITIGVVLFIAIPLSLIVWFAVSRIGHVSLNVNELMTPALQMFEVLKEKYDIDLVSQQTVSFIVGKLTSIGQSIIGGIGSFLLNLMVAVLLLFFLLCNSREWESYLASVLPMKKVNKEETMKKVNIMVKSNAIGIPLVALMQGTIALIGYLIFNVPNAGFAAVATGFCSVIPIVGTGLVWVPLGIYFTVLGQWGQAIGIVLFGALCISQSDNLLRFIIQKKIANTHPLITIFGVISGLSMFGFIGIIFGPLLVSLFLLFLDMFRKEYLEEPKD